MLNKLQNMVFVWTVGILNLSNYKRRTRTTGACCYLRTYISTGLGRLRAAVCTNSLIIIVYSQLVGKLLCCQRQLISWWQTWLISNYSDLRVYMKCVYVYVSIWELCMYMTWIDNYMCHVTDCLSMNPLPSLGYPSFIYTHTIANVLHLVARQLHLSYSMLSNDASTCVCTMPMVCS